MDRHERKGISVNALLTWGYVLLFVLTIASGAFLAINGGRLVAEHRAMTTWAFSTLNELGQIRKSAAYIQVATLRHATAPNSLTRRREEAIIASEYELNGERMARLDTLITDEDGRILFDAMQARRTLNAKGRDRVLALSHRDGSAAIRLHNRDQYATFEDFQNSLTALTHHVDVQLQQRRKVLNMRAQTLIGWLLAMLGLMGTVLVAVGVMVHRNNRNTAHLLRTNSRYREAMERAMHVLVADGQGRITEVSDSYLALTGYTREELIGQNPRIFNSGHHPTEFFKELWETVLAGNIWEGEMCNLNKDGTLHWVQSYMVPFRDMAGGLEQIIVLRSDTTTRRQAENNLALEREWLNTMLNSIGDGMIATDTESRIIRMNPVAVELTGWPQAEAMGRPLEEVFHIINQQTRRPAIDPVQEVLATGRIVGMANHTALLARNGREFIISDSGSPIRDSKGNMVGVILVFKDDTEAHNARIAVEESEARYRSFVEDASELIFSIGLSGKVLFANRAWCDVLGYTHANLEQCSVWDFIAPESVEVCRERLTRLFNGEAVGGVEAVFMAHDGRRIHVEGSATPRVQDGRIIGTMAFLSDVTARRQAVEALHESEVFNKGVLASLTAHIAVIDQDGCIIAVNRAWEEFALQNGPVPMERVSSGSNYFDVCRKAAQTGDATASEALQGMKSVLQGQKDGFELEYPCDAPNAARWFLMRGLPFDSRHDRLVVSHTDITLRKQAEMAIQRTNEELELAVADRTHSLVELNRDMTDSITYARRIQNAVLPSFHNFGLLMPKKAFLFSSPHSILSGDFLWWKSVPGGMMVAAVDCTGHGVPGALMSVIATNLLDKAVSDLDSISLAAVLHRINAGLLEALRSRSKDRSEVQDGMDVALCLIEPAKGKITFAGAYRPLWVATPDGSVAEYRGSAFSVGGGTSDYVKQFTEIDIPITPGTMIYLTSDGMQSQFGGPNNRKYGKQGIRDLFSRIHHQPTEAQAKAVGDELAQWMEGYTQTDDVLVVGLRLGDTEG